MVLYGLNSAKCRCRFLLNVGHHHGFHTHGEVGHLVQLEAELPHLVYHSLHGHQQVVSLGRQSNEALFCVHIISVRSKGRASRRIEVITRVILMLTGRSPNSEDLESSGNSASCAFRTSLKPSWTWAYTIESFPLLCPKIRARIPQGNRSLILPQSHSWLYPGMKL